MYSRASLAVWLLLDGLQHVLEAVQGNHAQALPYWFNAAGRNRYMQKPKKMLLYADDLAILSRRPEGPQRMLHALQESSMEVFLMVNLRKTEVLVLSHCGVHNAVLHCTRSKATDCANYWPRSTAAATSSRWMRVAAHWYIRD